MDTASARLAIGALSKRTGSKVETIRYYERVGLLPPPARSAGGYRLYGTEHLKRLMFVRRARALGFSIDEVRRLLDLADHRRRGIGGPKALSRRREPAYLCLLHPGGGAGGGCPAATGKGGVGS